MEGMKNMDVDVITDAMVSCMKTELAKQGESSSFTNQGEVMWSLVRDLTNKKQSLYLRLIDFNEMLSPFSKEFDLSIPPEVMDTIRDLADTIIKEAKEKDITITPAVRKHLDKISSGWVPYGYTIYSDCEDEDAV
jgi:hypothetical protein